MVMSYVIFYIPVLLYENVFILLESHTQKDRCRMVEVVTQKLNSLMLGKSVGDEKLHWRLNYAIQLSQESGWSIKSCVHVQMG